jgi:hypothetical protein
MGTLTYDPIGFCPIRRWVWVGFCTHRFVSEANLVPSVFVGLGLVLLNLDPVPVVFGEKLKQLRNSCIMCVGH